MGADAQLRWPWQVLHEFAHSRTTFTVATYSELARMEPAEAEMLIDEAVKLKWFWPAEDGIWCGALTAKRR